MEGTAKVYGAVLEVAAILAEPASGSDPLKGCGSHTARLKMCWRL